MRRVFAIIILLCVAYFIGGWLAVHFSIWDQSSYFSYAGIVGGLASVVGLLSFTKPALTKTDLQEIELDSLKSIAKTSDHLKELETERAKTKEELDVLELQKKEMELLVKKASLALFLKEQYSHHEKTIKEEIHKTPALAESIYEIQDISKKLEVLDEEIEADPHVLQLREIMSSASRKQQLTLEEAIEEMPPFTKLVFHAARELGKGITNIAATIR